MLKREASLNSIGSDGNTSFLRAARAGHLDKVLEHLKSNIDINTSNANGLNALHLASKDGHVDVVAELLKRGAVVDAATKKGNTALHIASLAGQEEVVKLLVQHGASVNVQSQNGFTPLYMAAQENHDNVVKYLLANGANQSLATEDGFTPLAVAMQQGHDKVVTVLLENDTRGKVRLPALHIAAKKDDVKAAKLLLENEHNPDVTSKSGFTPLHIASHYGNEAIANLLIHKGADVNYAAKHNITPLHVAAKWGKTNMVALLLEHGANIESKTRDGLTPLHCAARSGHEQVVDMLLERGAPISCKTKNGLAPLHMAAQGDHVDAARILLYHRAPVDEVTVDYLTALHVAAHCGHVRVAKLLLDRQADANARALNGFTPLHIACKKNRIKVVELLLKHGASIGATTESGLTPLHVASFMGCMNIVIYLLQHDANPDVPTVRGETPLHLAARANQTDIIRILLRNGAQVDARAREQQTPLHIASRLGNVDIVMLLLQHGAKVDTTTKDMYTALHIAAKEGQDEVAAVLIENGASLNATTKKGFTPLHLAAKYGNIKVAKLLLQKEAPVDAQGKNGVTPLHVASHYDHQNVALLLLDKGASPHATAKNGHTPLHIAARKNQMDIANTLLEYGAKPNAESKAGFTPLHLSAQEGHTDMSSLLIEHEANTNHPARNGLTPLHLCAQEDRVPVAEILVKNGAQVDSSTKGGFTPLHIASHYGQTNMVKFLLANGANVGAKTSLHYTPLHQAAQQGHTNIVNILLENAAQPNSVTMNGQTPLHIAQKLGYISVIETLKVVTETTTTTTTTTTIEEKYKVVAPEAMQETFMSDSEEEGGEDTVLGDHSYRYLTADEMKSLGDDSLPIDVTRDERMDSNKMVISEEQQNALPPQAIEDGMSPQYITENYVEYTKKYTPDNVDLGRHPINIGFLVSFLVDARGGAMRGCRHSGVRVIVPPRCAPSPTRITCRYVRPQRTPHPPPLMEGEALASRVLELGPVGAKFLGPVIIEVPHFAALRGKEREIVILRSDNGETWREHTVDASDDVLNEVLNDSFEAEDLSQLEDISSGRITRVVTHDFPQYFAIVTRIRQEVHAIGPEGGMVSSTVVPQVQAVFPQGALTKKIKVGLQAQPIDPELTAKLLGHGVAVSPVVTVEPRRRKFHKAITLSMPAPRAHSQGMINQYSGNAPTLRLLCSITGGTTRAQWEDVTGSTPLTFVNDCVSFTTTVSARFWLMDCRNIGDATKMATELYKEAIHVPFMAKFVVFAKRIDPLEARLRVFCMTDDKEDKTLEHQEHFTEVAKSRDVEVLEGKPQYIEFAGNLVPITKSGEPLQFSFRAFRENRLPFSVRVKDQHAEAVGRCLFMREPKVAKGEPPQQPICILNIVLPDDIVTETVALTDNDSLKRHIFLKDNFEYYRPDPRLADMSNLLGEDWVPLATQLGLTPSEINVIKSEYPDSVAKQAQSMLRMWISQSGNKAQGDALENALMRIGREDIIPQCLNVDDVERIPRIPKDVMERYQKDIDITLETPPKQKETYESKYSAEEKVVDEPSDEEDFNKSVSERRQQIEKRLTERNIPASSQRQEIVEEITSIKRQSMVEDKIFEAEIKQKPDPTKTTTIIKTVTTDVPDSKKTVAETVETTKTTTTSDYQPTEVTVTKQFMEEEQPDRKTTVRTIITETRTTEHIPSNEIQLPTDVKADRRDSDLLEGVTQRLETTKKMAPRISAMDADPNSPKFSKTPPPSPADFIFREQAAIIQGWSAPDAESKDKPAVAVAKQGAAMQETSSVPITKTSTELTSKPKLTPVVPKPKPRVTKSPDTHIQLTTNIDGSESPTIKSPVRDDTLDTDDSESLTDTYFDKKKFWESVTKDSKQDPVIKKRYSLYEDTPSEKITIAKRTSIHEVSVEPPVPKPRIGLQSSQSIPEGKEEVPMTFDEKIEAEFAKPLSEYQAAFVDHTAKTTTKTQITDKEEQKLDKSDSSESDHDQSKSGAYENTGYISDSGDVEHYISDSEIEDRVPQIRERQMSVFQTPVTAARKNIYERSMSLPTEDLYDLKNILQRKQLYEQQIRKEMVEEQLMTEIEEESSPERKALGILPIQEEEPSGAKSAPEKETAEITTVKDIAKSFGQTVKIVPKVEARFPDTTRQAEKAEEKPDAEERKSVKDIAKSFESETFIMGQKVFPSKYPKLDEKREDIIEKDKVEVVRETDKVVQKPLIEQKPTERLDLMKYMEESVDESTTDITMQDFETSEELGSKETDEISTKKHVIIDSASDDMRKDELTETITTDSMLLVSEKDLKTSDLQEGSKTEYKEDTSEAEEKSEESKITYASDIDRDSLVTKDIMDMLKREDHAETLSEEQEPSLMEKHTQKDTELDADLSETDQKSDASRVTYASDIEKDVCKEDTESQKYDEIAHKVIETDEEIKEKEILKEPSVEYDKYNGRLEDGSPLQETVSQLDVVIVEKAHKPDETKDLPREDVSTHKPDVDRTILSTVHEPVLDDTAEDETHKLDVSVAHKLEEQVSVSPITEIPKTHKEPDIGPRIQSSTESEQSVFSDHSADLGNANYREDLTSKPSDSMEVHVDKSEIEDSEKIAELEQDATDIETKSLDSLNATEISPKTSFYTEDNIPEITISLSGKQRRISEESEDSEEKPANKEVQKKIIRKSESGSPIYQPEEHVQDTVWEISVESQEQAIFDERASDLPAAPKVIQEKDDDLSSSLHEESDLGSEIHQDHSESGSSDKLKSDSHSEIEKLILESLHQQKISHEDAKIIASELLQDIEAEIQKRQSLPTDVTERPLILPGPQTEVSEYLKQLAEAKGLDSREVELVQSVLARKQRQLGKLSRGDTQASSMEITDEDLKYSGAEVDYSPSGSRAHILEEQIEHLEVERIVERKLSRELGLTFGDTPILGKPDDFSEKVDDDKYEEHKTEIDTKVTEKVKTEKDKSETVIKIEGTTEAEIQESEKTEKTTETLVKQSDQIKGDRYISSKKATVDIKEDEVVASDIKITISDTVGDDMSIEKVHLDKKQEKEAKTLGKYESKEESVQEIEGGMIDQEIKRSQEYKEDSKEDVAATIDRVEETKHSGDVISTLSETAMHKKISSTSTIVDTSHTESKTVSSTVMADISPEDLEALKKSLGADELRDLKFDAVKTFPEEIKHTSSDDSKSSQDEMKSPEEQISTSSSDKKGTVDHKTEVIMRRSKARDTDTSSSSPIFKPDRKSGLDFEAYSSSGESHYQSFELDSGRSRPCSSDVEGLIAAGSSEYESALTSQDISATTHLTSYHTAVSSLSSKESMKSLDSESSGNLASVEVSEASETLVPSEYDIGDVTGQTLDDFSVDRIPKRQSTELSDSELIFPDMHESLDVSEEDVDVKTPDDVPSKMKRSCEMTFQPEPKVLVPESPHSEVVQEIDERFGTSLDEGSVLSVSLSSTSSATALRTVIEMSHGEVEKADGSLTISGTPDHDDMGSRESLVLTLAQSVTETSTSTIPQFHDTRIGSVTITTSTIAENGIQSVSTQVTSQSHSPELDRVEELKFKEEPFDPKKRGHRRCESTISSNLMSSISTDIERKLHSELAESDKYMSIKEGKSDEKKDVDEAEKDHEHEPEADQVFHKDLREGRYVDGEYDLDGKENDVFDLSRPQSQVSKSDSERERITSTAFSDDRPDSELAELAKQCSSSEAVSDPIERPATPEPCEPCDEYEIKDDTPEFSSEAQASVGELEQEYSSAIARSQEISEIKKQILSEITVDKHVHKDIFDKRDSHGKLSSTSSEKSSFEEAEAEVAFGMVAHVSPAHKIKQICPILEDEDAEKHELETRERAQKEYEKRRSTQYRDQSPGSIPDIKVTQHMAPLVDRGFRYPDLELEKKDEKTEEIQKSTPQTPASSKSSESTDQGREYNIEEPCFTVPEEPEDVVALEEKEEKVLSESKSEAATVMEKTATEEDKELASPTESPNSDSFEMLEKPDLIDDFVVIEEVGKEASEMDLEGKSVRISSRKYVRRHDQEVEEYLVKSAPSPSTKMTDIKYYPDGSSSEELGFDFEESPPQPSEPSSATPGKSPRDYIYEYDKELEANRKWIEQQFQGSQAAMIAAGYGYEMEFERGPLEDIKEEDINDFDSSRIGSLSSQKESGGSLGSVKDSYSSTPEYDVLAGRKYFTRSGDHDDVSMSSLQEFENLERAMSLEHRRCLAGSQDSSSNGSFKNRFYVGISGQGDDVSVSSLKEFEGLEKACIAAHKIEIKVKEEEAMLSQIDEGQESIASESESCETVSGTDKKLIPDSDDEDYEKRMFEIDEIIKQAQSNVERFIEIEKTESLGRGDSFEEVAKVPDLDLDTPITRSATKVQWAQADDIMATSTDSLDLKVDKPSHHDSTDSLDQKTAADIMTASTDSIEFQAQKCKDVMTSDSIEIRDGDRSYMITSDSLEMVTGSQPHIVTSDSIDEDGSRIGIHDQSSSSTGKDFSSSVKEDVGDIAESKHGGEYMLGSTDSIASTSTATHATYQYESDSVYSGTSGGSNTMVSSTETIEPPQFRDQAESEAFKRVWFDDDQYLREGTQPYVTEIIEPCDDEEGYSHTVHRQIQLPPEISKVTFSGPDAEEQMRKFMEKFDNVIEEHETEEIDEHGNKHIKRVVQKRFVIMDDKPDHWSQEQTDRDGYKTQITRTVTDDQGSRTIFTQQFDTRQVQRTPHAGETTGEASGLQQQRSEQQTAPQTLSRAQGSRRRPLRYEISIDDQTEVDPREHDWRFNLPQHAEAEETSGQRQSSEQERPIADQHMLSDEMKKLLKELEEESKK